MSSPFSSTDADTKGRVRRVLQAGGATVLPRTINHLVDNFDTNITFIVTEPHFFMRKDSEVEGGCKYQRLAAACNSKGVPLVSASYVEVALTSPVSSGSKVIREQRKKLFSVLRNEMIAYHQRLGSGMVHSLTHYSSLCFFITHGILLHGPSQAAHSFSLILASEAR